MAMSGNDRADQIFAYVSAQPRFSDISKEEQAACKAQLRAIWGTDLAYIVGHAQVNPSTLQNPAGQPVATAGGPTAQTGSTTSPSTLIGLGTLS